MRLIIIKSVIAALFTIAIIWFYIYEFSDYKPHDHIMDNTLPRKFYVINLDRQPERLSYLSNQLKQYGVSFERVSAVDGFNVILEDIETHEKIKASELTVKAKKLERLHSYNVYCRPNKSDKPDFIYKLSGKYKYALTPGEFGLECTTRYLWKEIASKNEIAVIFEDDALLFGSFNDRLNKLFQALPNQWDVVYLDSLRFFYSTYFFIPHVRTINKYLARVSSKQNLYSTHAYMIHSQSAAKLLESYEKYTEFPVDAFLAKMNGKREIFSFISRIKMIGTQDILSEIDRMGRERPKEDTNHYKREREETRDK